LKGEGFVHLLVSLWDCGDPDRLAELRSCLRRNVDNPAIARIHLFIGPDGKSWRNEPPADKIEIVPLEGYPSFRTFFQYANRRLAGRVVAIANADIFFDGSLERLRDHDFSRGLLALTRHNVEPTIAWTGRLWERNYGSHDAWIFRPPLPPIDSEVRLGYFGCDGLIARELQRVGVGVTNPSADIKAWHVHATRDRVTDLFAHPKSYFPGNVDPRTRHQFGFRCVPIEPLGRWKLYTVYSPSHEPLYRRWFLGTMQDDFEVVARSIPQTCESAEYSSPGWTESVSQKIPLILEAIDAHTENGFFVFSDVDIQWLGPVQPRLRRLLAEFPDVDIFFQHDALKNPHAAANVCTGFFVCKGNIRTRAFWTLVGQSMLRTGEGDQRTAQKIIARNLIRGLKVGYLPPEFWGPGSMEPAPLRWSSGMFLDPPPGLLVHHANWTVGVDSKVEQLEYVARKVALRRFRDRRRGAIGAVVDHWAATKGPSFIPMPRLTTNVVSEKDALLNVVQVPRRLPGAFWALAAVDRRVKAGNVSGDHAYRAFRRSVAAHGLKLLTVEQAGDSGAFRLDEDDADILVQPPLAETAGRSWKRDALAVALGNLPADCDKVAWLDASVPLADDDWMAKAVALVERYEVVPLCDGGWAEVPGAGGEARGSAFKVVEFGPAEIRADLSAHGSTGLVWVARKDVLLSSGLADVPAPSDGAPLAAARGGL